MSEYDIFWGGMVAWAIALLVYICLGVVAAFLPVQHGKREPMEYNPKESLSYKAEQSNFRRNKGNRAFARARWKQLRRLEPSFAEWLENQEVHARRVHGAQEEIHG